MKLYGAYSDERLVELLSTRADLEAFTELYNRYWEPLLVVAVSKLKNEQEAKDILQDVFMNLWRRKESLQIHKSFQAYIAVAVKLEILRKLTRQKAKFDKQKEAAGLRSVEADNVTDYINFENTRRRLEETVQGLPEKCRLVFQLSREKGLSEKQIAEELNISPKTVEAHIGKALKVLRSSLQNLFSFFFF